MTTVRRLWIVSCLCLAAGRLHGTEFELLVPPAAGEKYESAQFRVWIPEGVARIQAVIIRQHGCGRRGSDHADDLAFQSLARAHNAALVGTHFVAQNCEDWFRPERGSERALLAALASVAVQSGHAELTTAPWAIWGHSGGARWALQMAGRHPQRVLGVFARSGAETELPEAALSVPTILNYGEQEKTGRFERVHLHATAAFEKYRPQGALWAIAVDPKSSHDCRNARDLAIPFFDALLTMRRPAAGESAPKPLAEENGVRVRQHNDYEILAPGPLPDGTSLAMTGWLPRHDVAEAWREYVLTGAVKDHTPPDAPAAFVAHALRGESAGVELSWSLIGDRQSGIQRVELFRDGMPLTPPAEVQRSPFGSIWNYGDEPEPARPQTRFFDRQGTAASKYEIVAVNHAGLPSERRAADVRTTDDGFTPLFDGRSLEGWIVHADRPVDEPQWIVRDGMLMAQPGTGWIGTREPFENFVVRLEFKIDVNGNSGVFLTTPDLLAGQQPHVEGIEIQILDDEGPEYAGKLQPYQYCGSIYGAVPAQRGALRPRGEWNAYEITCQGDLIRVVLNGQLVAEGRRSEHETLKGRPRRGAIGLQNHGHAVAFRNVRVRLLPPGS